MYVCTTVIVSFILLGSEETVKKQKRRASCRTESFAPVKILFIVLTTFDPAFLLA